MDMRVKLQESIGIAFATLLLLFTPMLNPWVTFVLALTGLVGLLIFSGKRLTTRHVLATYIAFVVALLLALAFQSAQR